MEALIPSHYIVFAILAIALILFVTGKWRYDIVSLLALLAIVATGVLPIERAFEGFSHPAVIIVASMFIMSRALINSGVIDLVVRKLSLIERHPVLQLMVLTFSAALISGFVNNIGALALTIPIAIHMARKSKVSPALFLIPLAFASHLGGFLTLIGTPRNIIVSTFRKDADPARFLGGAGEHFAMFDFAYVGAGVAIIGIIFLSFIGWRLITVRKTSLVEKSLPSGVEDYITEVRIPEKSKFIDKELGGLSQLIKSPFTVVSIIRGDNRKTEPDRFEKLKEGDILLIKAPSEVLTELIEKAKLELTGAKAREESPGESGPGDLEAVVSNHSIIVGRTWKEVSLRLRFGVNLLAISRQGQNLKERLDDTRFKPGDVLLLQGQKESLEESAQALGCLPLAEREISLGRDIKIFSTLIIFVAVIATASLRLVPLEIIFLAGALAMIIAGFISLRQAYESINWPIIVLIGAMITFSISFEISGAAETIAGPFLALSQYWAPIFMLGAVLVVSMLMSDFINATASAVLMSPIAILVAGGIGASIDPFLMAVAIGASSSFLTPIGHESNTIVMGPGGYKFSDYWKVGLPLEIIIVAVSLPLLVYFWPM